MVQHEHAASFGDLKVAATFLESSERGFKSCR
jgi:hypothetical protein